MYPHTVHNKRKLDVPDEVTDLLVEEAFAVPTSRQLLDPDTPTINLVSTDDGLEIHTEASAVDIFMPIFNRFGFHLMSYDMTTKDKATLIRYTETEVTSVDLHNICGTFLVNEAVDLQQLPVYDKSYA